MAVLIVLWKRASRNNVLLFVLRTKVLRNNVLRKRALLIVLWKLQKLAYAYLFWKLQKLAHASLFWKLQKHWGVIAALVLGGKFAPTFAI